MHLIRSRHAWITAVYLLAAPVAPAGAGAGVAEVRIGAQLSGGTPGREVPLQVFLSTGGASVAGLSHTLGFAAETPVAADAFGQPRCATLLEGREALYGFAPAGCTPGLDCSAVEVRFPYSATLPALGSRFLYACTLTLAADTPLGTYPSTIADAVAQGPDGNPLPNVVGVDGEVTVIDAYPALIEAGTARGAPGERVALAVRLHTDVDLSGVQADIAFPADAPIAARANGRPDCRTTLGGLIRGTSFAFRPSGCTPAVDCTGVRALLLTLDSIDPLPDDAILYTCEMDIAAGAAPGSYALPVSEVGGADPDGGTVLVDGSDGTLIVELPTPTPTETPAATAIPSPTGTALPTSTPTARGDDDGGCQVTAAPTGSAWALLLVPLMRTLRRPRRRPAIGHEP